jgi:hypothetical protein
MKTYLKNRGRSLTLTIVLILAVAAVIALCYRPIAPAKASGEAYPSKTFILPYNGETAKTIVLHNRDNGNAVNSTTGASAAATTWDSAELAGTQHAITNDWLFTIPAHNISRMYIKRFDVAPASIDKTTVYTSGNEPLLYNPKTGLAYTDTNPVVDNMVNTSSVN